ncbi:MAG: DUF4173 domain-containing protein [Anaerolineae bacterium]|nr:DUF4173 domain-containing protein [Anaerolineae bacterium]
MQTLELPENLPNRTSQNPAKPAKPNHTLALLMLAIAAVYAIFIHDILWLGNFGINVTLAVLLFLAMAFVVAKLGAVPLRGGGRWLAVPIVLFAVFYFIRDSQALRAYNVLAILIAFGVMGCRTREGQIRIASVASYVIGMFSTFAEVVLGVIPLLTHEIDWQRLATWRHWQVWRRVLVGIFISLPLLLVFGGLFAAADAGFARIVRRIFNLNLTELIARLIFIFVILWMGIGLLSTLILPIFRNIGKSSLPAPVKLGLVEFGLPLVALTLLFATFVVLQLTYLFGGEAMVSVASGLTYADYARRGFFELVMVAMLLLLVLLLTDWLMDKSDTRALTFFRITASILIALMAVVMVSAFQRMWLYTQIYGLSELRLYPTAFMLWLAVTFGWFMLTTLRGRTQRFIFGAMVAGFATLLVLNLINPDALIVRFNAQRAGGLVPLAPRASRSFDSEYVTQLSADAVPTVVEIMPSLPLQDQMQLRRYLQSTSYDQPADWRSFHLGRWWASQAIALAIAPLP